MSINWPVLEPPNPFSITHPVMETSVCDSASLSDDCQKLTMTVGGQPHVVSLFPMPGHVLLDLAVPFAAGQVLRENTNAIENLPTGRYTLLKTAPDGQHPQGDALAFCYLGEL